MSQTFKEEHWVDANGNPAGGVSTGTGFTISWQNGPLGRGAERKDPNGAFVETLIQAVIGRIEFYQDSKFNSVENAVALLNLENALIALQSRTARREEAGTEGTHEGS